MYKYNNLNYESEALINLLSLKSIDIEKEYGMLYLSRFSTVAVQMHGKHQRTVQFCQSAPVGNLSELL